MLEMLQSSAFEQFIQIPALQKKIYIWENTLACFERKTLWLISKPGPWLVDDKKQQWTIREWNYRLTRVDSGRYQDYKSTYSITLCNNIFVDIFNKTRRKTRKWYETNKLYGKINLAAKMGFPSLYDVEVFLILIFFFCC